MPGDADARRLEPGRAPDRAGPGSRPEPGGRRQRSPAPRPGGQAEDELWQASYISTNRHVAAALFVPAVGLRLFWNGFVLFMPMLLLVAPGLWRNVCPLAALNQLPRALRRGCGLALPAALRNQAPLISLGLFLSIVPLRQ